MKNKKDLVQIILLASIAIILLVGLILIACHFKRVETKDSQNLQDSQSVIESEHIDNTKEEKTIPSVPKASADSNYSNSTPIPNNTPKQETGSTNSTPDQSVIPKEDSVKDEAAVVSYFENLDSSVRTYQDENNPGFREKAKNAFTTVVDFLFYDSQIHGYTFKELTTSAKLKIVKVALKIDHKIDSYFPNYKTTMKTKMQNLKGKAALLYLKTTAKLCESVGASACNEARQDFKNMKESFGITWDIIKNAASSSYGSLKTILSEWYQSIR